jgi:hypothetical protein
VNAVEKESDLAAARLGVRELIYVITILGSLGGLYTEIRSSDARQSAQIEGLQKQVNMLDDRVKHMQDLLDQSGWAANGGRFRQ